MKIILLLSFALFPFTVLAQSSYHNRLDSNLYKGKTVYFRPHLYKKDHDVILNVFKTPNDSHTENNVPYPLSQGDDFFCSSIDSLLNRKFFCVSIVSGNDYIDQRYLKLENEVSGTVFVNFQEAKNVLITEEEKDNLIIKQNKESLAIKKDQDEFKQKTNYPCLNIDTAYDQFHFKTTYSTSALKPLNPDFSDKEERLLNVIFSKEVTAKKNTAYYIFLSTTDFTPLADEQGVIIILKNGKRLIKPFAKVHTSVNINAEYVRSSLIRLNPSDILLLKQSPIKEFELYDSKQREAYGEFIRQMLLCLLK